MDLGLPEPETIRLRTETLAPYLDSLFARLDATGDDGFSVRDLSLGGIDFKVRCTSSTVLDRYIGRLAGVPPGSAAMARRIDVVAAAEIGWPRARWVEDDWQMHVFDGVLADAGYVAAYPYFDGQWIVHHRASGVSVHFVASMEDLLPWDSGSPLRLPLHWALLQNRQRMVHAGSLGVDGRGVLIAGPGGAGKSGTTLAGLAAGLTTVGDDYLLLDQKRSPAALPLYRLLKQDAAGLARIDGLAERLGPMTENWQGKFEFDPERAFPGSLTDRIELCAILLPVVAHAPASRLEPVSRPDAVRFLTTAMLDQLPAASADSVLFFAGLTARLPVFRLHLSEDPAEIAGTIRDFIVTRAP